MQREACRLLRLKQGKQWREREASLGASRGGEHTSNSFLRAPKQALNRVLLSSPNETRADQSGYLALTKNGEGENSLVR